MAKLVLTIQANDQATAGLKALQNEVQVLSKSLLEIKVNKDLTAQINALTKNYTALANAQSKITANANKQAIADEKLRQQQAKTATETTKLATAQARLEKATQKSSTTTEQLQKKFANLLSTIKSLKNSYPQGTFDGIEQSVRENLQAAKDGTKGVEDLGAAYNTLSRDLAVAKAETEKVTTAVVKSGDSIASLAKKFLLWQVTATLVMKPLRLIQEMLSSIDDTLIKTEDAVIALQRVLPTGSATDSEISSRLYKIAADYGQTFENVSEIATNFARSGMSWADTIKATEAAVLALNVAELDAEEATNGLIAILSQFGLTASDLETVIDELNKTADNFPVTTQKILAALQRTGSAASNANLSLEQTIALITALSKATGRSGENIGTALNSLIQYSSKASALDTFAALSEESEAVVEKFRQGGATILDVWRQVSAEIKNLKADQADLLDQYFATEDGEALKEALDGELEDIYTELGGVYDTANTFRKNYFIALLGNMDTVEQAMETLGDAAGYSQEENKKYLDTYTARVNALNAQWEDLVNNEQGWLGFKKGLVESGSLLLSTTKWTGGLTTALLAAGTAITAIFGAKIVDKITAFNSKLSSGAFAIRKNFEDLISTQINASIANDQLTLAQERLNIARQKGVGIIEAEAAVEKAETAVTEANTAAKQAQAAAIGSVITYAMLAVTVISAVVGVVRQAQEEAAQARQEIIEGWKAIEDEARNVAELYSRLNELSQITERTTEQQNEFLSVEKELAEALGYSAYQLKGLTEGTNEYTEALKKATQEKLKQYLLDAQAAQNAQNTNFAKSFPEPFSGRTGKNVHGEYFYNFEDLYTNFGGAGRYPSKEEMAETDRVINLLQEAVKKAFSDTSFTNNSNNFTLYGTQNRYQFNELSEFIANWLYDNGFGETNLFTEFEQFYKDEYNRIIEQLTAFANTETIKYLQNYGLPSTQSDIDDIVSSILNATGATEGWRDEVEEIVKSFVGFKETQKEINEELEVTEDKIETLTKDNLQSLIDALKKMREEQEASLELEEQKQKVIDAQNALLAAQQLLEKANNGTLTLGDLGEADLQALLNVINDMREEEQLALDIEEKKQAVLEAQNILAEKQAELTRAQNALRLAQMGIATDTKDLSESALKALANGISDLLNSEKLALEIEEKKREIIEAQNDLIEKQNALAEAQGVLAAARAGKADLGDFSESALKALADGISDLLNSEKLALEIEEKKREIIEAQNDLIEKQNALAEAQSVLVAAQKGTIADISDLTESALDALIDGLKRLHDEEEDSVELEEKKLAVLEAQRALENAKNERDLRRFNSETGQYEWQVDEKKVADAEESLKAAVDALNEYIDEQAWDDVIAELESGNATNDSIKSILDKWLSEGLSQETYERILSGIYDLQSSQPVIDALNADFEALQADYDEALQNLNDLRDSFNEYFEQKAWEEVKDAIASGNVDDAQIRAILDKWSAEGLPQETYNKIASSIESLKLSQPVIDALNADFEAAQKSYDEANEKVQSAIEALHSYLEEKAWNEIKDAIASGNVDDAALQDILNKWRDLGLPQESYNQIQDTIQKAIGSDAFKSSLQGTIDQLSQTYNEVLSEYEKWLEETVWKDVLEELQSGKATNETIKALLEKWKAESYQDGLPAWYQGIVEAIAKNSGVDITGNQTTKPSTDSSTTGSSAGSSSNNSQGQSPSKEDASQSKINEIIRDILRINGASGSGINKNKLGDNGEVAWNGKNYKVENGGEISDPLFHSAVEQLGFIDRTIFGYKGGIYGCLDGSIVKLKRRAASYGTSSNEGYDALVRDVTAQYGAFDRGGVAKGLGYMPKAIEEEETVLGPDLTKEILSPVSNERFHQFAKDLGLLFETQRNFQPRPIIERVGGATDNRIDNSGQTIINGVKVGSDMMNKPLAEVLRQIKFMM